MNGELTCRKQSSSAHADDGLPDRQNGYIGSRAETLEGMPETVAAFMEATRQGCVRAADHPAGAADLMRAAGEATNPELVRGSMAAIVAVTDD